MISITGPEQHNTMNITNSFNLLQHVSADVHGHRQVVVQIHNKRSILGRILPFLDIKYDLFRSLVIIPVVE